MARPSKRESRAEQRRAEAAIKLMVVGAAFVLGPLFLRNTLLGKAFEMLIPIGLLMLAAGGVLLWLGRRAASKSAPLVAPRSNQPRPVATGGYAAIGGTPVVCTPTELEPASRIEPVFPSPRQAPVTWGAEVFEVIEWRRFEALVEELFQQAGFETKSQSHGADEGIDIWLYSRNQLGTPVSIVQCKHWSGKRVGVDKIRELRGVMASKGVTRGQFATTSTFTPDAVVFAKENAIHLLDVDGLLTLISKRTPEQQQALLAVATEGDYWRPTCVNCGVKMLERTPRAGGSGFWGCTNYPRCKTTMQMRAVELAVWWRKRPK